MNEKFFGPYRGIVTENDDPLGRMRIKASIPAVHSDSDPPWALPCVPPGVKSVPDHGAEVWIEFEEGDPLRPIWMGTTGRES